MRRIISDETKVQAVADSFATSIKEAAEKHGVSAGSIQGWRKSSLAPTNIPAKPTSKPSPKKTAGPLAFSVKAGKLTITYELSAILASATPAELLKALQTR